MLEGTFSLYAALNIMLHLRVIHTLSMETTLLKLFFVPSVKGSYQKGTNLALPGSKFLSFRVDPFSEGHWSIEEQTGSHKSCLSCNKWPNIYQVYPAPLMK